LFCSEVVRSAGDLHCADHVSWPRQPMCPHDRHHAIVTAWKGGTKVKVIHVTFTGQEFQVREELIDVCDFIRREQLLRYMYEPNECHEPHDVINRASSKRGPFRYDVRANNCERFARWCKVDEYNTPTPASDVVKATKKCLSACVASTATGAAIVRLLK